MGRVFYRLESDERNVDELSVAEFDALALRFVGEITNVKRDIWDVFARCKFLNWLLSEGDIRMEATEAKIVLAEVPAEEKTSAQDMDETASEAG